MRAICLPSICLRQKIAKKCRPERFTPLGAALSLDIQAVLPPPQVYGALCPRHPPGLLPAYPDSDSGGIAAEVLGAGRGHGHPYPFLRGFPVLDMPPPDTALSAGVHAHRLPARLGQDPREVVALYSPVQPDIPGYSSRIAAAVGVFGIGEVAVISGQWLAVSGKHLSVVSLCQR